MEMAQQAQVLADIALHTFIEHPLPWRIESDWTYEVHAADGTIVAKCRTQKHAENVIRWAKLQREELDRTERELETWMSPD